MRKEFLIIPFICIFFGCGKAEQKILRESIHGDSKIVQYAPLGNATVDNYLIVAFSGGKNKNLKNILIIRGMTEPLDIELKDEKNPSIFVHKRDMENLEFFDCAVSTGKVRLILND